MDEINLTPEQRHEIIIQAATEGLNREQVSKSNLKDTELEGVNIANKTQSDSFVKESKTTNNYSEIISKLIETIKNSSISDEEKESRLEIVSKFENLICPDGGTGEWLANERIGSSQVSNTYSGNIADLIETIKNSSISDEEKESRLETVSKFAHIIWLHYGSKEWLDHEQGYKDVEDKSDKNENIFVGEKNDNKITYKLQNSEETSGYARVRVFEPEQNKSTQKNIADNTSVPTTIYSRFKDFVNNNKLQELKSNGLSNEEILNTLKTMFGNIDNLLLNLNDDELISEYQIQYNALFD